MPESFQKSAFWVGPENIKLKFIQVPEVVPGSLLVRVESCAICGSDLRIYREGNPRIKPPRIIGHEISGVIVEIGKGVDNFNTGDFVAIGADVPCGKCIHCLSGFPNCCDINYAIGYQFDGGFSQYILLDPLVVNLGPVQRFNKRLNFDSAALAEPLACCINGYERGLMRKGHVVVIIGAGPIGNMLAMLAPHFQASKVIIIEPSETRLSNAKKISSVDHVINPFETDPVIEVMRLTDGFGADLVFTANSVVKTHEQAIAMLAKHGVVNFFGGLPGSSQPIQLFSNVIHYREAYITGSHGSTPEQHKKALKLIETGEVEVNSLVTHQFPIDEIDEAFKTAMSGKAIKVVIKPNV